MASMVLGAVGAVIGGIYGGPTGAQMGWAIGSAVGSLVDPQKLPTQYGPKLGDLKVITSTYGTTLPTVYSTIRLSGNIIWSTPIIEKANSQTQEQGNKGAPIQETVTYTYSQSFAVAICEGPITGIRKIWANGKLIYNVGTTDVVTGLASIQIANGITIYLGTESQMPDALIQSYAGVNKTSAYRGTAYIVFNNLQLANYGNRTPNLEFEIVNNGADTYNTNSFYNIPLPLNIPNDSGLFSEFYSIIGYDFGTINTTKQQVFIQGYLTQDDFINNIRHIALYNIFPNGTDQLSNQQMIRLDPSNNIYLLNSYKKCKTNDGSIIAFGASSSFIYSFYVIFNDMSIVDITNLLPPLDNTIGNLLGFYECSVKNSNNLFIATDYYNSITSTHTHRLTSLKCSGQSFYSPITINVTNQIISMDILDDFIYTLDINGILTKYDLDLNFISTVYTTPTTDSFLSITCSNHKLYGFYVKSNPASISSYYKTTPMIYDFTNGTPIFITYVNQLKTTNDPLQNVCVFSSQNAQGFFYKNGMFFTSNYSNGEYGNPSYPYNSNIFIQAITQYISNTDLSLDQVVSKICLNSGLSPSDIDVTSLSNEKVSGYLLANKMTARAAIEGLMSAYFFDAIESDNKIKFIKRGNNSILSITEDDLSACNYGSNLPDQLFINRMQQLDLPEEITVAYMDLNADYQTGSQYSRRLIAKTLNTSSIQLPIALTSNKAKSISDITLYNYWQSRTTFKFTLSNKYLYLDPTDIINVTKNNITYNIRLVDQDYQGNIITYSAVEEDSTIYLQNSTGSSIPTTDATISTKTPTNLQLLDIPILRDQDDQVGFYISASGYLPGWNGCQIYKSIDGGGSFNKFSTPINNQATLGNTTTVLNNFTSGNIFDEINDVIVKTNNILSSVTEISVLNGSNVCLIGSEIIQFKNATLIATNTYKLTGLLRGKFGTEWAMISHAIGERFILLTNKTTYIENSPSSEYNLPREYTGVSFGMLLNDSTIYNFTNTGVAQKPYSPVQIGGGRDSAGNITINWTRRTRINGSWNSYTDVSLGETTELYSIDIMNGTTIVRTINGLTTPTYEYTTADQVTDFGSNQSILHLNVYQISSIIGRGYAGNGII
jgi:hypothetical protein